MSERREYEMTEEQYERLLDACKPVPYIVANGTEPRSPQENANDIWAQMGREMGFDWITVRPTAKGDRFFTAEPVDAAILQGDSK